MFDFFHDTLLYRVAHPNPDTHSTFHSTMRVRTRVQHPVWIFLQLVIKFHIIMWIALSGIQILKTEIYKAAWTAIVPYFFIRKPLIWNYFHYPHLFKKMLKTGTIKKLSQRLRGPVVHFVFFSSRWIHTESKV